ncbi:uncharacterized protein TRIADDRAFT_60691 [Trichoplax adhaerens]|uniref:Major facilitator superfamily (MFS) profile domain-containing protein n=1 Tax=Trichoplax adhaerens TaxID=10228 RepID=B3S942_TRIAD|nr:hypothetical protein TRIADDRAFT_60691 [Trichoplax adhaerens]EDV20807.1 hypothetical protein TRIADDRAFT_60691 [Trichoplax adhaerens]|eukprot:XP_002116748.1 hypothetical protein TRIADDRAFT_60691 [Trichoplax adhaerens]
MAIEKELFSDSGDDDCTTRMNQNEEFSDTDFSCDSNNLASNIDEIVDSLDIGFFHYMIMIGSGLGFGGYAVCYQTISFITISACDLDINRNNKGWLSLAFNIGYTISSGIFGRLADTYGRRKIFIMSLLIYLVCVLACVFAYNYIMLVIMNGFIGIAYGGIATVSHTYVIEFFPRRSRGKAGAFVSSFLILENLYCSAIALLLLPHPFHYAIGSINFTSWRLYVLIGAIPALISFCILLFMPNSLRFVLAKNDKKGLRDVLRRINKINSCFTNTSKSYEKVSYSKLSHLLDLQENDIDSNIRKEKNRNFMDDIREMMKEPNRRRFILLSIIWLGYCTSDQVFTMWLPTVMSFYASGKTCWHNHNKTENVSWNTTSLLHSINSDCQTGDSLKAIILDIFIGNLLSLPILILCFLFINRIGRKRLFICLAFTCVICILMILLLDNRLSVMIVASIFTAFTINTWIPCKIWSTELFPTEFRTTVTGILFVIGHTAAIAGLIAVIAALFLPDTSNSDIG